MTNNAGQGQYQTPTNASHRRQVTWQIVFPLALFSLSIIALAVWLVISSNTQSGFDLTVRWASISAILMLIPLILFGFLLLAIILVLIYGMAKGIGKLPGLFVLIIYYSTIGFSWITSMSNKVAEPILKIQSWKAIANRLLSSQNK